MPLYEVSSEGLIAFRQLRGAGLYESEIEELLWSNLDDLTGEVLFPIRRQPRIVGGGRPDIVALDRSGAVVVIEVKRDVDRSQLAQCLEYAGWARGTNLDELAGLFHKGAAQFWRDWQDFTETSEPVRVARSPRLILVARDFEGRTKSALHFLLDNGLPVSVLQIGLYEDSAGRRFLDLEGTDEPVTVIETKRSTTVIRHDLGRVHLADLVGAGLLQPGDELTWTRPRLNQTYRCVVTEDARLRLSDGRSPVRRVRQWLLAMSSPTTGGTPGGSSRGAAPLWMIYDRSSSHSISQQTSQCHRYRQAIERIADKIGWPTPLAR